MNDNSTRAIFVEYFLSQELLHYIRNFLPLPFLHIRGKKIPTGVKLDPSVEFISDKAKQLRFDQAHFRRLLTIHINALVGGKESTRSLESFVQSHRENVESEIRSIPNTPDKARDAFLALIEVEAFADTDQVYDVMVLLSDEVPSETIATVVRNWKEEAREHRDSPFPMSDMFWVSRDFMQTIDGVSGYRFREHFGVGEFELAFAEVESMLAGSLLEGSSGIEANFIPFSGDTKLTSVPYDLWLVSRSRNLPNRIRDFVNIALRRIAAWQYPEGWWTDFQLREPVSEEPKTGLKRSRYLPNTYTTALCSLCLLKLSIAEPLKQKGVLGAKWLLERQNPEGSWSREHISKNGIVTRPHLFVTLLSLEAIARSGIENVEHSIELGLEWIMQQQNDLGMWDDGGFPFPFMTVLALEVIKSKDDFSRKRTLDPYLSMSRDFLNRSVQFSLEENSNSHRLAIIAAFQGIEAFLYSALGHPSVNIKTFEKENETIGMRKALTRFQTYLQDKGEIKRGEVISYRNSLDTLAYLRDQVVHKGIDMTQSTCRPLIDDALRFAAKYSSEIFGFDILV